MFIAMNQFQVHAEQGSGFEEVWRNRESYLQGVSGFVAFALLKGDEAGDYISHSTWQSREAFLAWAQSDAFRKAHDMRMPDGIVLGHPRARFYEAVIVEGADGPTGA